MSASKYNVLHLHLVDAESWPLEIRSYPNMTAGAYAPEAIYTQKQVGFALRFLFFSLLFLFCSISKI